MFKLTNINKTSEITFASPSFKLKSNNISRFPTYKIEKISKSSSSSNTFSSTSLTYTGSTVTSNGTLTFTLPSQSSINNLEYIKINNLIFTNQSLKEILDDNSSSNVYFLQPGQFIFNQSNNQITLKNYENQIIKTNSQIIPVYKSNNQILTDFILDFPKDLKDFNIVGSISISQNFNNHPSCTINLITDNSTIQNVRNYFDYYNRQINLYNIPFRVSNYSETSKSNHLYPNGEIEVSVQLEGYYRALLDDEVEVSRNNTNSLNQNSTGTIGSSSTKSQSAKASNNNNSQTKTKTLKVSLNNLVSKKLTSLKGRQLYIEIPDNSSQNIKINLQSSVSSEIAKYGCYANYSSLNGVWIKSWFSGGDVHTLNFEDIIGDLQFSKDVITFNKDIDDDYLKDLIENEQNNQQDEVEEINNEEEELTNKSPDFEYPKTKQEKITIPPNKEASKVPEDVQVLKTLDHNFDVSGQVNVEEIKTLEGDTVLSETINKYGFAYTADEIFTEDDDYELNGTPGIYWKKISSITKTYKYDSATGYLLSEFTSGWQLQRFKQETEEYETVITDLENVEENDFEVKQKQLYIFRKVAVIGSKSYLLRNFRDFYNDLGNGVEQYLLWEETDKQGNITTRYKKNPLYVEPKFVYREVEYYNCFDWIPNPDNIDLEEGENKKPDYTTGEIKKIIRINNILQSKNTNSSLEGLESNLNDNDEKEDSYSSYVQTQSAQDGTYRNSLATSSTEIVSGRPSEAYRKPLNVRALEENQEIPKQKKKLPKKPIQKDNKKTNEIINRENTNLSINRTFGIRQLSLVTFFKPYLKEGDTLIINFNNFKYITRINAINHDLTIIGKNEITGLTKLTLGIYDVNKYKQPSYNGISGLKDANAEKDKGYKRKLPNLFTPYKKNEELGDLSSIISLMSNTPSRGNF